VLNNATALYSKLANLELLKSDVFHL